MNRRRMIGGGVLAAVAASAAHGGISEIRAFETITLVFNGNSPTAEFPSVQLLATKAQQQPYQLIGYDLSASFANTEGAPAGFFLVIGTAQPLLGINQDSRVIGSVIVPSLALNTAASPDPSPVFFDEGLYYDIPSGLPISLYGCNIAAPTRAQAMFAIVNVFLVKP